jgi:Zn-dependent peptidase ImmA (M78 family)
VSEYEFFKCDFVSKQEIWQKAEDFRKTYCYDLTPPINMELVIEKKLKLNIEPKHHIKELTSIDAYLKSDRSGIVVDNAQYMDEKNRYERRLRFSFAHEVGHFVLHKNILKHFEIRTPLQYYNFITNTDDKEYNSFEWQANEFAGRLLVPKRKLTEEFDIMLKKIKKANMYHLLKEEPSLVLESSAPQLCKPFGVSEDVIVRRVEREGLLKDLNI